jgi:hypothetical protein
MVFFEGARQSNGAGFPANDPPDGWIHYNTSDNQLYIRANGAWTAVFAQNQTQTYYVGKHGNDANDGLHPDNAVLTIGQAITLANAQTPSTSNRFRIQVLDGGVYAEDIVVSSWLLLDATQATIQGEVQISSDSMVDIFEIDGQDDTVLDHTGAGVAYARVNLLNTPASYTGVRASDASGELFFTFDTITVGSGGIAIGALGASPGTMYLRGHKIEVNGNSAAGVIASNNKILGTIDYIEEVSGTTTNGIVVGATGDVNLRIGYIDTDVGVFTSAGAVGSVLIGDSRTSTHSVAANTVAVFDVSVDGTKLDGIEAAATADQTDAEIETAYNNQVAQVSAGEKTAGTETAIRRFSPEDVADMAEVHGFEGNAHPGVTTGDYILPVGCVAQVNNGTTLAGEIDYLPVCVGESVTIDRLAIHVNAGSPGTNCRIAIYDNANGRPNSLIGESGIITTTVGGLKTYTLSQALEPGWYWVASQVNAATATFKRCASTETLAVIGATVLSTRYNCYYETHVYGAFPATASITGVRSRNVPIVGLRAT